MTSDSFTEQRRAQKRPGSHPVVLSEDLLECLTSQLPIITADPSPLSKTLANGINTFVKSSYSPDDYQKLMACVASVWKSKESKEVLLSPATVASIATHWLIRWLCRCDLRFVHKGIINLLRADGVTKNAEVKEAVISAFSAHLTSEIESVLASSVGTVGDGLVEKDGDNALEVTHTNKNAQPVYMQCANFIDAVSVSASPIFPQVFEALFPRTVLLCADILVKCVMAAINNSIDTPSVHSDNLEEVRFVVRVVATHVHRHIGSVPTRCASSTESASAFVEPLSSLLFAATAMLSTAAFPKDVLNAAGLLVATIVSSAHHHVSIDMLRSLCVEASDHDDNNNTSTNSNAAAAADASDATDTEGIRNASRTIMAKLLLDHSSAAESKSNKDMNAALPRLFARLVPNGRFAFYKGLLSHFSSPMHEGSNSMLMQPIDQKASSPSSSKTIVHDVIFPIAKKYSDEQKEPDTRFMAIQTLDHVVRYLAATFTELLKSKKSAVAATVPAWFSTDVVVPQTEKTILEIVSIITSLWDDPTQQVSGPLYSTYNHILDVSDALQQLSPTGTASVVDPLTSFQAALRVRADRRGKYHTMLALLSRLSDSDLLTALRTVGKLDSSTVTDLAVFQRFVESLIITANNPKICSVSGDLFAVMASRFLAMEKQQDTSASYWQECIIKAVTNVLTSQTLSRGLSVSDSMARGNIITHMVTPILKQGVMGSRLLNDLLSNWAQLSSSSSSPSSHLIQASVDLLYRARSSGVSLEAVGPEVWAIVKIAGDAYDTTLRLAALNLLLLSTKASERATDAQLDAAARVVEFYAHNGGDSTTRNDTLGVLRLWMKRLADSLNAGAKKDEDPAIFAAYVAAVFNHLKTVVATLVRNVSRDPSSGEYLASERRYFSFVALETVWSSAAATFTDANGKLASHPAVTSLKRAKSSDVSAAASVVEVDDVIDSLYPSTLRDALKATLYEGWDMLRENAARLIAVLCEKLTPAKVFPQPYAELKAAVKDLSSGTHRSAQGAARIIVCLFEHAWPAVVAEATSAAGSVISPLPEIATNGPELTASAYARNVIITLCAALEKECVFTNVLTDAANIRASPLHGRTILIGALFPLALTSAKGNSSADLAQSILTTCTRVATHCSGLVSGSEKVDCRGHVFSEGDAAKETDNRVIVNNSWLGVRASCAVAEKVLTCCPATSIGEASILGLCSALVSTLLLTKHNGVMGKARATLRFICRLLLKTRCDTLRTIPTTLINDLLGESGVGSSDEGRILRRSQGLPHAILPILEAEDASLPLVLFPRTMNLLIDLIGIAQSQGAAATSLSIAHSINSLNVLKFIFDNSIFATRITPWSQDAFIKAAKGFTSANWAVRNSSLMLFSSVMHRVVGDHPSKGGGGITTSLHDLQLRIPNGLSYALEALQTAVERTAGGFGVDPALFPLLLLFSMLCPDAPHVVHDQSSSHIVHNLIAVLQRCGHLRNVMVRAASGSALVAIVPVADLEGIVTKLIVGATEPNAEQNTLHGRVQHLQKVFGHYVGTLRIDVKNALGAHSNEATRERLVETVSAYVASPKAIAPIHCMSVGASFLALAADVMAASDESSPYITDIATNCINLVRDVFAQTCVAETELGFGHRADIGAFSDAFGLVLVTAVHLISAAGTAAESASISSLRSSLESLSASPAATLPLFSRGGPSSASSHDRTFNTLVVEKTLSALATYHRAATAQRFSGKAYLVRRVFGNNSSASGEGSGIKASIIASFNSLVKVDVVDFAVRVLKEKVACGASTAYHPQVCEDAFTVLNILARDQQTCANVVTIAQSSDSGVTVKSMCALVITEENSGMRGSLLEFASSVVAHAKAVTFNGLIVGDLEHLMGAIEYASRSDQPTVCRSAAVFALGAISSSLSKCEAAHDVRCVYKTPLGVAAAALWLRLLHDDEEEVRRTTVYAIKTSYPTLLLASGGLALSQPFVAESLVAASSTTAADLKASSSPSCVDAMRYVNAVFDDGADDTTGGAEEGNVDEDDEEDGDLFDEEQDNMFWEMAVMHRVRGQLVGAL